MKKKHFGLRFYLYNVFLLSLIIGGLFALFFWYYIEDQEDKIEDRLKDVIDYAEGNVEDSIKMLDTVALQLSTNPELVETMKSIHTNEMGNFFETYPMRAADIYELLWSYILNSENVSRVSAYNSAGDFIYAGESSELHEDAYRDKEFIESLEVHFEKPRVNHIFINEVEKTIGIERKGISIIREIKNSYLTDTQEIGYVEVKLNIDKLENKVNLNSTDQILLIYDLNTEKIIGTSIKGYVENTKWTYKQLINQLNLQDSYYKTGQLSEYNLGFIALQDKTEQNSFIRNAVLLGLLVYVWLMLSMAWIQKHVVTVVTKPLIELCKSIQNARTKKDRSSAIQESNIYEIEILASSFREVVGKLEDSMQNELESKTSQIKTQLYALQAQMNPHFIHNTIAIIQSYAIEEDYDTIIDTCSRLSDLIRYSSKLAQGKTGMIHEVNHIENYMALVKLRYEDNISYTVQMPQEMKKMQIPSFILQPMIENSLQHGLKNKPFPWEIEINCYERDKNWIIEIKDNGVGMSLFDKNRIIQYKEDMLQEDKGHVLASRDWEIGGLTIRNIIARLYLEYGKDMIFEMESRDQLYTIIRLGGPIE